MIPTPHKVSPGESVSAAQYNALLDYVLRTTPRMGRNVFFEEKPNGIFISAAAGDAPATVSGTPPFTVRWHEAAAPQPGVPSAPGAGQWEIYLPPGCVAHAFPYFFIANPQAKLFAGHEKDDDYWYVFAFEEVSNEDMAVVAHVKWPATRRNYGINVAYLWVRGMSSKQSYTDQRLDQAGDAARATVATCRISWSGAWIRRVAQVRRIPLDVAVPPEAPFDLQYTYRIEALDPVISLRSIEAVRLYLVAGFVTMVNQPRNIPLSATYLWLKIDTTVNPPVATIEVDPDDTATTDQATWIRLYRLSSGCILEDDRSSLYGLSFYR